MAFKIAGVEPKDYKKAERTSYQKVMHVLTGAYETPPKEKGVRKF